MSGLVSIPPNWAVPGTIGSTTPNTGAFTTLTVQQGGNNNGVVGQIYVGTADSTDVTGTLAATSIVPTGSGSMTIPTSYWNPGKCLQWRAEGYFTTTSSAPGSWTLAVKIGATNIWSQSGMARTGSLTKATFALWGMIACRTTGSGGTVAMSMNRMNFVTNTLLNNTSPVTVDISANRLIDIILTPSATDAGEHVVTQCFSLTGN